MTNHSEEFGAKHQRPGKLGRRGTCDRGGQTSQNFIHIVVICAEARRRTRKGPLLQEGLFCFYEALKPRLIPAACPAFMPPPPRRSAILKNYFFLVGFLVAFFFAGIVFFSLD